MGVRRGGRGRPEPWRCRLWQGRANGRRSSPGAEGAKAPSFLVGAIKDPLSGNLDRIQIIKGWVDADGEMQEKIYNVV